MRNRGPSGSSIAAAAVAFIGLAFAVVLAGACASQPPPAPKSAPGGGALAMASPGATAEGAPVKLLSATDARVFELASISITSLDRLLTNGATLVARAVPLPIEPAGLRDMLLGQAGLSPEVAANLDLSAPSGAVVVSTGAVGGTGAVMAVTARGSAEAARVVAALGKQVGKRGAVVLVDNGSGGRGWIFRDGNVIVFSDDVEALARGARLAEEARHAVAEDVTAVIYPGAIARANGTDIKTALTIVSSALQAAQAAQSPASRPSPRALEGVQDMLQLAADAATVEAGLVVDASKGFVVRVRLRPQAGSGLEKVAQDTHPYELDGTLLTLSSAPAFVGATSVGTFMRAQMTRQREVLQASKAKGAAAALAFQEALMTGLAGQASFVLRFAHDTPLFAAQVSYALKDATAAAAVANALTRLDRDAARVLAEAQGGTVEMFTWTAKTEKIAKLKALHFVLVPKKELGLDADIQKKIIGKGLEAYVAVAGTRLLTTIGRDAKADLGKLAVAKPAAPTGVLADTLAVTKGRDSFFQFDLAPVLSLVGTFVKDKKMAALSHAAAAPIPLYGTAGGDLAGKFWSIDLTIPPTAFVSAGGVIKAGMAASVGGGGSDDGQKSEPGSKKKAAGAHKPTSKK
jgi:hypothetical protein